MIYGNIPFDSDEEILNCKLDFDKYDLRKYAKYNHYHHCVKTKQTQPINTNFNEVNDLIKLCLNLNTNERLKLENILEHKWFKSF